MKYLKQPKKEKGQKKKKKKKEFYMVCNPKLLGQYLLLARLA